MKLYYVTYEDHVQEILRRGVLVPHSFRVSEPLILFTNPLEPLRARLGGYFLLEVDYDHEKHRDKNNFRHGLNQVRVYEGIPLSDVRFCIYIIDTTELGRLKIRITSKIPVTNLVDPAFKGMPHD